MDDPSLPHADLVAAIPRLRRPKTTKVWRIALKGFDASIEGWRGGKRLRSFRRSNLQMKKSEKAHV